MVAVVSDQAGKIAEVEQAFPEAQTDTLDGLTLTFADGAWANLRWSRRAPSRFVCTAVAFVTPPQCLAAS